MAGGGGEDDVVVPVSPRAQQPTSGGGGRRGHRQRAAWLPLDIIVTEIAARSDPATLVRSAATCRDARRRVAEDPGLGGRLCLRDTERFVLPLLRGHMTRTTSYVVRDAGGMVQIEDVYLLDAAATAVADSTSLVKTTFASGVDAGALINAVPVDSRRGLFLVRATTMTTAQNQRQLQRQLFVWNPVTCRRLVLPPGPAFPEEEDHPGAGRSTDDVQYVLLVGDSEGGSDNAVGRPFQVLKVKLVLSEKYRSHRRLLVQTFSSEHGAWSSPCTEIPTPNLQGSATSSLSSPLQRGPLVVGDVVHWLCLTDAASYMLMLHVRAGLRVDVTALPTSFPRESKKAHPYLYQDDRRDYHYLLATAMAGGNPVVLVADADKISAWEQSKHSKKWKPRPRLVIENETVLRRFMRDKCVPQLEFFGEKSGALLIRIPGCCLLWLDLQTKKILRCFSLERLLYGQVYCLCPYEMDLAIATLGARRAEDEAKLPKMLFPLFG